MAFPLHIYLTIISAISLLLRVGLAKVLSYQGPKIWPFENEPCGLYIAASFRVLCNVSCLIAVDPYTNTDKTPESLLLVLLLMEPTQPLAWSRLFGVCHTVLRHLILGLHVVFTGAFGIYLLSRYIAPRDTAIEEDARVIVAFLLAVSLLLELVEVQYTLAKNGSCINFFRLRRVRVGTRLRTRHTSRFRRRRNESGGEWGSRLGSGSGSEIEFRFDNIARPSGPLHQRHAKRRFSSSSDEATKELVYETV